MASIDRIFTARDQQRIRVAVEVAEGRTSGEIVPYVVAASDVYAEAPWKGAACGALVTAVAIGFAQQLAGWWIDPALPPVVRWALPTLLGALAGYVLVTLLPPLRRALVPASVLELRVRRRAAVAFVDEEVFATADRTGILIFLSLFEHRVVVLGDAGIYRRVAESEWEEMVRRLSAGIRAGRAAEALVEAIAECGELLQRRGVGIRDDDVDELSNELRRRDR